MEGVCGDMTRDTILLFTSVKEPVYELSDEDAGKLFKAILAYQTGEDVNLEGLLKVVFIQVKQQIDYNNKTYEERVALRSEAGKKGAEARWQKIAEDSKRISANGKNGKRISANGKNALNDNDNENVLYPSSSSRARTREDEDFDDGVWNPDELVTTKDGTQIRLGDVHFGETVKIGKVSKPSGMVKHPPLTEEEKERILNRLEEFKKRRAGG